EALEARLKVHGIRPIFFTSPADTRALLELEELAGNAPDPSPPEEAIRGTPQLLARLKNIDAAILLDFPAEEAKDIGLGGMGRSRGRSFFRILCRQLSREGTPLLIAAASDPDILVRDLEARKEAIEIHPLEPFSFHSIH